MAVGNLSRETTWVFSLTTPVYGRCFDPARWWMYRWMSGKKSTSKRQILLVSCGVVLDGLRSSDPYGDSLRKEPADIVVRDEANEVRPDVRPQARKNRKCIRWNTLRIFSGRARRRWSRIVHRSRNHNVGQVPSHRGRFAAIR